MAFNIYQRIEISTANDISCILHCFTASDANILNLHPWHSSAASGADLGAPLRPAVLLFVFGRGQKIIPNQKSSSGTTPAALGGASDNLLTPRESLRDSPTAPSGGATQPRVIGRGERVFNKLGWRRIHTQY